MDFEDFDEQDLPSINTEHFMEKFWPGLEEWIMSSTWGVENE